MSFIRFCDCYSLNKNSLLYYDIEFVYKKTDPTLYACIVFACFKDGVIRRVATFTDFKNTDANQVKLNIDQYFDGKLTENEFNEKMKAVGNVFFSNMFYV